MKGSRSEIKIGAVYGRVSVDESAEVEHGSLEQQGHLGREYAASLSTTSGIQHIVKYNLIEERGVSGKNTNRPKYQELLDLVQSRRIDFVIAKEISRLSRSTRDFCDFLSICKENDVAVHIRGMAVDPRSPMGEMMFKMFAMIAEFERQQIVERTKSSIRSAMKNNAKINGGPTPLGFDKHKEKKGVWVPNQKELKIVTSIMKKFNERLSYKEVLDDLKKKGIKNKTGNSFNTSSLKRLLSNCKYVGKMSVPTDTDEKIWVNLPFGEVVPKDLFEQVQANIKKVEESAKKMNRNGRRIYILSGFLYFEDDSSFVGQSGTARKGNIHYYYYNKKNKVSLSAPDLEKSVIKSMRIFENDEKMIAYANELKKDSFTKLDFVKQQILKIEKELKGVRKKENDLMDNLNSMSSSGTVRVIEWLDQQLKEIEERKIVLQKNIVELEKEQDNLADKYVDAKSLKYSLSVVFDKLDSAAPDVQRGIVRQLFKKITVSKNNKVNIDWRIPCCGQGGEIASYRNEWGG